MSLLLLLLLLVTGEISSNVNLAVILLPRSKVTNAEISVDLLLEPFIFFNDFVYCDIAF